MAFRESPYGGSNSGIMLGGDGPMMSGTWQNPRTGHKFTVRSCEFIDGQIVVKTTTGQTLDYNILKDYTKVEDEHGRPVSIPNNNIRTNAPKHPKAVMDMLETKESANTINEQNAPVNTNNMNDMIPEDRVLFQPFSQLVTDESKDMSSDLSYNTEDKQGNSVIMHETYDKNGNLVNKHAETLTNTDEDIDKQWAHKVLKKKPLPSINVEAAWEDIPSKAIETLIETLGVEPETLIDYYVERIYNEIDFEKEVKEKLNMLVKDVIENIQEMGAAEFYNAYRSTLGNKVVDNASDAEDEQKDDSKEYDMTADFQLNQQEKLTSNPAVKAKKPTKKPAKKVTKKATKASKNTLN